MKSKVYVLLGMLTLGTAICVSSLTQAQPGGGAPTSKIAMINLAQVFKGYSKITAYAAENKKMLEPLQAEAKKIQMQIEAHVKALENKSLPEDQRVQTEKNLTLWKRTLEDLNNEAKMKYTKQNEEQMVIVYRDVMDMAERYAVSHGYELVMHFNDVPRKIKPISSTPPTSAARSRLGPVSPCTWHRAWT